MKKKKKPADRTAPPLLVLDFDGTLAPIRLEPQKVRMPAYMIKTLSAAWRAGLGIIILSGRPVSFLRRIGLDRRIRLIGNFGNNKAGRGEGGWKSPLLMKKTLSALRRMPGVRVERKLGWCVHYRQAAKKNRMAIMREIGALKAAAGPKAVIAVGRMAVELMPPGSRTKADVLRELLRQDSGRRLVFIGDDQGDLEAMRKLRNHPRFSALAVESGEIAAGGWPPVIKNRPALAALLRRMSRAS